MSNLFKPLDLKTALAHASIHQKLRHYTVAKQLLAPFVTLHPEHTQLQQRYRQLEQQQKQQQAHLSKPHLHRLKQRQLSAHASLSKRFQIN